MEQQNKDLQYFCDEVSGTTKYICRDQTKSEVLCIFPVSRHHLMNCKECAIPDGLEPIRFETLEHAEKACDSFNSYHGGQFKPELL